ncbi:MULTISPECIES: AraC family transcriptional regulator [Paenibacillus]|uniref:AraC family transcriptional regulator n=2 Tax=Paenibacillus TaxID=44249 RepID=A0ABX2ZIV5_PAEPO|nr:MULTISPECIES: AraC family transcriptional regulator [Paenibacillus]MDR6775986.1 AraC-like DNA-binding protein [Paenibacillus peoriae]ODA10222.1 AraC family transcriptional regulator [Paenibacillus polymyxa]OME69110.1 AraC family transcriptional regulator [Paenibacillus peoriae]OMF29970.1 AraC family transcriptional regulator [Paenibacillus peoriae]
MSENLIQQQQELTGLIERHSLQNSTKETAVPSLFFYQHSSITEPAYRVYKPSFCVVVQGLKEILLAQERFEYGPSNYLIASMNLPVIGQIIKASTDSPYLSLKLEFTQNQILEVLNDCDIKVTSKDNAKRALFVGRMESSIQDAVLRLARLLDTPGEIPFLAPLYTREILYRLLQGPYGVELAQIAVEGSSTYRIREAIDHIVRNWDQSFRIEDLADTASMSVSSFHRHFKEVTAMSPIQFQKQLRLQEARRILLAESADAADVAFRVGYESSSQFSREYSRTFGAPPRADIKRLKEKYDQVMND